MYCSPSSEVSMSTWRSFPDRGWRPIGDSVSGFGKGEGPYDLSYAMETQTGSHLNGRVSALFHIATTPRVQGLGIICRADEARSFVAFYVTNDKDDPARFSVRLAAFKLGRIVSLVALKDPIDVTGSAITMTLQFYSGEITGEIVTDNAKASITRVVPEVPFPGHSGLIRFYGCPTVATNIQVEAIRAKPVLPEVEEAGVYQFTVFLSHSSRDKETVRKLTQEFKKQNITYWVDEEQITFGDTIVSKIEDGLQKSKYVVVCLSENVMQSGWCRAEYGPILYREFSGDTTRRVIPLSLDGSNSDSSVPLLLSDKLRADYTDESSFAKFLKFLKG